MELTQGVRFDTLELSPELLRALLERNIYCMYRRGLAFSEPISYTETQTKTEYRGD